MTDNIRITLTHEGAIIGITVTPEIARQIVALGSLPVLTIPNGSIAAKPGWSAPVEGCGIYRASDGTDQCSLTTDQPMHGMAIGALAAIRRGDVPGFVSASSYVMAEQEADALRAKLAEAKKEYTTRHNNCQDALARAEKAEARVAELEREQQGYDERIEAIDSLKDKALADLAAMTERAEKAEQKPTYREFERLTADVARWKDKALAAIHYATEIADHAEACGIVRSPAYNLAEQRVRAVRECDTPIPGLIKERDAARAEAEALRSELMEERNHREKGESVMRELTKQRDALKARKVTLPALRVVDTAADSAHNQCVLACSTAIRAAGVGVE